MLICLETLWNLSLPCHFADANGQNCAMLLLSLRGERAHGKDDGTAVY